MVTDPERFTSKGSSRPHTALDFGTITLIGSKIKSLPRPMRSECALSSVSHCSSVPGPALAKTHVTGPDVDHVVLEQLFYHRCRSRADFCRLFGRALQYVGIDWNAHKVFDMWIKYETDHGTPAQIAHVYTQAVATVTEDHKRLNTAFLEFTSAHAASVLMSEDEYAAMTIKVCTLSSLLAMYTHKLCCG